MDFKSTRLVNTGLLVKLFITTLLFINYSCQKDEQLLEETATQQQSIFSVPEVEAAKSHFNANNKVMFTNPASASSRTSEAGIEINWDNSEAKLFKTNIQNNTAGEDGEEGPGGEDLDILYTPTINMGNALSKTFVGSIEIYGNLQSKIISLLYLESTNYTAFSGYMLIYDLNGNLEYADKYISGQRIDPNTLSGNGNSNALRTSDCDFATIGCLLDWLGGNLDDLAAFLANQTLDEAVVNAYVPTGTTINDSPFGFSGNIPFVETPSNNGGGGGGNFAYWNVPYWYNFNKTAPEATAIAITLDLHPQSSLANWLLNQNNQELLDAIAKYLNDNRELNQPLLPDGDGDGDVNENPSANTNADQPVSQEAINHILDLLYIMRDNPGVSFDFDSNINPNNVPEELHFDTPEELQTFINGLNSTNIDSESTFNPNNPNKVIERCTFPDWNFDFNVYIEQTLGNNYNVDDITSNITGFTMFVAYEQLNWTTTTVNSQANVSNVDVNSYAEVTLVYQGVGTIATFAINFNIWLNMNDGSQNNGSITID